MSHLKHRNTLTLLFSLLALLLLCAVPALAEGDTSASMPLITLDAGDVLSLLVVAGGLIVTVIVAWRNGTNPDAALTERLHKISQQDRDRAELAYQRLDETTKLFIDTIGKFGKVFAGLTPFKSDDAAVEFLEDVQTQE